MVLFTLNVIGIYTYFLLSELIVKLRILETLALSSQRSLLLFMSIHWNLSLQAKSKPF